MLATVEAMLAAASFQQDIMTVPDVCGFGTELIVTAERLGGWERATTIGPDGALNHPDRRADTLAVTGTRHADFKPFEDQAKELVGKLLNAYARNSPFLARAFPAKPGPQDEGYDLLRYKVGDEYREHIDASHTSDKRLGHVRRLSVVVFLNADFSGGELVFPRQGLSVRPAAGSAVVFPSTFQYPHSAQPVTRGVRYALVTWLW